MTGSAKQSISPRKESWIASSQGLLAMTMTHTFAFPRREAPEFLQEPFAQENRGRRECRVPLHP
jgi:hypothetical protein